MRFIVVFVFVLGFMGCRRDEEAYVRRTVNSVGATTLLADAARLASEHTAAADPTIPLDASLLPASFRAFAPVETLRYDRSFLIVTARSFQHRVGVFIQPFPHPEPKGVGNDRYVRIAPCIYFYES
jgi:hypothetical protein